MRRYCGEDLQDNPRIALVTNDNLGNFVIATPLMQMLRARHRGTLDYFGGTRVIELAESSDLIDSCFTLHGSSPREMAALMTSRAYDLVVNIEWTPWAKAATSILAGPDTFVCGPCIGHDGRGDLPLPDDFTGSLWSDEEWLATDVRAKHPCLRSSFIGEIFCRLAYLDGEVPGYRLATVLPSMPIPDVLLSASASLPEKLWPLENWVAVIRWLKAQGLTAGLLGAKPKAQAQYWKGGSDEEKFLEHGLEDLRGKLTLPEVVGAISQAKAVLTLDNGILHLTCATNTPVIGLFREGIARLWAPPVPNLQVVVPPKGETVASISAAEVLSFFADLNLG